MYMMLKEMLILLFVLLLGLIINFVLHRRGTRIGRKETQSKILERLDQLQKNMLASQERMAKIVEKIIMLEQKSYIKDLKDIDNYYLSKEDQQQENNAGTADETEGTGENDSEPEKIIPEE